MILVKFLSGRAHLILLLSLVVMGAAALLTVEWRALFGFFDILTREIQVAQRHFHAELGAAIHAVKANERLALFNLTFIGFLYGVFHAAGPGHGKFVISTYLATSGAPLSRGIALTVTSSAIQGLSAVAVVELTVGLLGLGFRDARQSAIWIEIASYGLIVLIGLVVTISALKRFYINWQGRIKPYPEGLGDGHSHQDCHDSSCDHAHGPTESDLATPLTLSRFIAIAFSVGLRPCTGAVLVLLFARALDIRFAGYGAVVGISLGTALTVSALAAFALYARHAALAIVNRSGAAAGSLTRAAYFVAACGGAILIAMGLSLLIAALQVKSHPLF